MIKKIRAVEWSEGRYGFKRFKYDIQVMLEGSNKWVPIGYKLLKTKPKQLSKDIK
jgi:hypothetical protein